MGKVQKVNVGPGKMTTFRYPGYLTVKNDSGVPIRLSGAYTTVGVGAIKPMNSKKGDSPETLTGF